MASTLVLAVLQWPTEATCWNLHPELRPSSDGSGGRNNANSNEAGRSECMAFPVGRDVFVVDAAIKGVAIRLGLDSMAALNLIRSDALPRGVEIAAGGPMLHGVGTVGGVRHNSCGSDFGRPDLCGCGVRGGGRPASTGIARKAHVDSNGCVPATFFPRL